MFTGLVEELGKIRAVSRQANSVRLTVEAEKVLSDVKMGDSIAVDGACLTVVAFGKGSFTADVMPETFDRTTLSQARLGAMVNLERTLRLGDRLGGHIVSGHVDGVGVIQSITPRENANILKISAPGELSSQIVPQGSVAVDGVSLTVVDCGDGWFTVSLIPHTWSVTVLSAKKPGDRVNVETDMIGKYVARLMRQESSGGRGTSALNEKFLAENGFF